MKDYTNYLTEKPYSCNIDGCSKKFTNEDHLTVHKKRHDMVLNIGLGSKDTFTDQTPTPTQFIKNCEEVGLFQDLQNVNFFEETFKNAVEAVKAGKPICLEKSMQTNTSDDTLHTPNIFPDITDLSTITLGSNCLDCDKKTTPNSDTVKKEVSETVEETTTASQSLPESVVSQNEEVIPVENVVPPDTNSPSSNNVILNVPEGHLFRFITPDTTQSNCNMVVIKNSDVLYSAVPMTVKDKLKKNLSDKKSGKVIHQQKVPISKCPPKKMPGSLSNKFSKFSKNALKLISKLENSENDSGSNNGDLSAAPSKKQKRKGDKFGSPKESRSEFLARCRAASSRCREKKKMYILYLEKVNRELLADNRNLQLVNSSFRKQICDLHAELLKHRTCNAADKGTEAALATMVTIFQRKTAPPEEMVVRIQPKPSAPAERPKNLVESVQTTVTVTPRVVTPVSDVVPTFVDEFADPNSFTLDVAEVTLSEKMDENEIPLVEHSKPPDIIVRFNSDFPARFPADPFSGAYVESAGDDVRKVHMEHSYFLKRSIVDVNRDLLNYKSLKEATESRGGTVDLGPEPFDRRRSDRYDDDDLTGLTAKSLLEHRTPPPLILLKPFKKRTLQSKRPEKT